MTPRTKADKFPIDHAQLESLAERFPTPFYLYDETAIRSNARRLTAAFQECNGFREYFAVKANPNPFILQILRDEGFGADCSSMTELLLCRAVGFSGEQIMFTSNNTPVAEYRLASQLGAVLNLDDSRHVEYVHEQMGLPPVVSLRYNPGAQRTGNAIIGQPEQSKFGMTRPQLLASYGRMNDLGVKRFGLHGMIASNELDPDYFVKTAAMLFQLCVDIRESTGTQIEFVNLGGGIGIPYHPEQAAVDLEYLGAAVKQCYREIIEPIGMTPVKVFMENGRMVTGPYGWLVTRAVHTKQTYKQFIGVDACMAHLMRPGMYGAYHHITVAGKIHAPCDHTYDIVGSLCENNDKFAIDRPLPEIQPGDLLIVHDAGAHGHAMGFQYNGKLRCAELLRRSDGSVQEIRRAETAADYFATLAFPGLDGA